jgi:CBS domain containing-hemolysin-like protein
MLGSAFGGTLETPGEVVLKSVFMPESQKLAQVPGVGASAPQAALVVVVIVVSFLSLILGELVPKSLAMRAAERYAALIGRAA